MGFSNWLNRQGLEMMKEKQFQSEDHWDVTLGRIYTIGVWDPQEPSVVGRQVTGRVVSVKTRLKRYPDDVFWLVEGDWITHLVPRNLIQEVQEYKRRLL